MIYVLSNGCGLTSSERDMMRDYMAELIEQTFNPFYSQVYVIPHDLTGDGVLSESLISAMNGLSCNIDGNDETDYDGEYAVALNALVTSSTASAKKVVMISFCEPEDGDDNTCDVPAIKDPDNIVETIVVNVGTEVSNSGQFVCLVNGGTSSPIYNEYCDFGGSSGK